MGTLASQGGVELRHGKCFSRGHLIQDRSTAWRAFWRRPGLRWPRLTRREARIPGQPGLRGAFDALVQVMLRPCYDTT